MTWDLTSFCLGAFAAIACASLGRIIRDWLKRNIGHKGNDRG
jgi:hypothetical protein